jgi:hypothetical protein
MHTISWLNNGGGKRRWRYALVATRHDQMERSGSAACNRIDIQRAKGRTIPRPIKLSSLHYRSTFRWSQWEINLSLIFQGTTDHPPPIGVSNKLSDGRGMVSEGRCDGSAPTSTVLDAESVPSPRALPYLLAVCAHRPRFCIGLLLLVVDWIHSRVYGAAGAPVLLQSAV